jgi:hypothetical protein
MSIVKVRIILPLVFLIPLAIYGEWRITSDERSEGTLNYATNAWQNCIAGAVQKFDDGRSDVDGIARIAMAYCFHENDLLMLAMANGDKAEASVLQKQLESKRLVATTEAIAVYRQTRRTGHAAN